MNIAPRWKLSQHVVDILLLALAAVAFGSALMIAPALSAP